MVSYGLFAIHILLLALTALFLHSQQTRIGLTPLLFFIAALIVILNYTDLMEIYLEPFPGYVLRTGGHVYVPVILMTVLILYISDGTQRAQLVLYALTGINLLILLTIGFMILYANVRSEGTLITALVFVDQVFTVEFLRGVVASLIAFVVDVLMLAIVRQGLRNLMKLPDWISAGIALTVALWVDAIVFQMIFYIGSPSFNLLLPGDVVGKSIAALIIWPALAIYLTLRAPKLPEYMGNEDRPTFDVLFGIFGGVSNTMRELQEKLKTNREIYTQLTENIQEIFWLADVASGHIVYLSPAFERITGYQAKQFYNQPNWLQSIVHPDDRRDGRPILLAPLTGTENDIPVIRIVCNSGQIRWMRNRAFPISSDTGVTRYAGILEDVTSQQELAIREQQIATTQAQVRVLNDSIRDASHDLKNPLATILLKVEFLERLGDRNPQRRQEVLDELKELVDYERNLIDDLFTLSRVQGNDIITMQVVDLNDLVHRLIPNIQMHAEEKGLNFELDLTEKRTRILVNERQFRRVVANLLNNAVRYTEEGQVRVSTRTEGEQIVLQVRDTGIGIAQEDLPYIFERFYRSEDAKMMQNQGTGLGLAICKAIVEYSGGTISVESQVGVGSVFTVKLPPCLRDIPEDTELPARTQ